MSIKIPEIERITYQKGNKWVTDILLGSELLHQVVTNNKISSASKAGKWIKDNKELIEAKIRKIRERKEKQKQLKHKLLDGMGHQVLVLMHQIDKLKETYKNDNITIHFIDTNYTPALGHIFISNSAYPLDYNSKTKEFFVAIKVINTSINQNLFEDHKKYIISYLERFGNEIVNLTKGEYYPTMKNPFDNNHIYLVNYLTMQILHKVSKKSLNG